MSQRIKLKDLVLQSGAHQDPQAGMCVMEAVAYFAKEPHSASPQCACPVLTSYMVRLNDSFNSDERQLLKPYIKRLIGTRDGNAQKRANVLAWASITKFTPYSLELIGLIDNANELKSVKKFDWDAARSAAYNAARSAAYNAAYNAARSAAYSAAYNAAYNAEKQKTARLEVVMMALKALDEALEVK